MWVNICFTFPCVYLSIISFGLACSVWLEWVFFKPNDESFTKKGGTKIISKNKKTVCWKSSFEKESSEVQTWQFYSRVILYFYFRRFTICESSQSDSLIIRSTQFWCSPMSWKEGESWGSQKTSEIEEGLRDERTTDKKRPQNQTKAINIMLRCQHPNQKMKFLISFFYS